MAAARVHLFLTLALTSTAFVSAALKLPSYIPEACRESDPNLNECVLKAGRAAIPHILNGDKKFRVPNLNPMFISELRVQQGTDQIGLTLSWRNASLYGLKDIEFRSCDLDVKNKHTVLRFHVPKIKIIGNYVASGRVLLLPVTGNGLGNLTLNDMDVNFSYDWPIIKKADGKEYIDIRNPKMDYKLNNRMYIHFDNLFEGNKVLGDNINNVLNENWRELDKEVGPGLADALGEVFQLVMKNICDVVPYNVVFKLP